jgi:UDP-N-acetylmuramoyl-tripeptide--D-alanyl-D-alanine ligase
MFRHVGWSRLPATEKARTLLDGVERRTVISLSLAEITGITGGILHDVRDPAAYVTGAWVCDSREAGPGGMFAAIIGERVDGHDYAAGVVAAGAVGVLASRPVGVPAVVVPDVTAALGEVARHVARRIGNPVVVGITGSAGKTTTKDLLAQVLECHGPTVSTARSLNTEIGLPLTVLRAGEGTRFLVLEMGARGIGHIRYLTGLVPVSVGLVINVGTAHVGEFGSQAAIAEAKGELVEALPGAGAGGLAVLNADDGLVSAMASRTAARVLLYGQASRADVRADRVTVGTDGRARFTLLAGGQSAPVALQYLGEHQVSNALGAAAVAWGLGMPVPGIAAALSGATPRADGRLQVTERPDGVLVINDAFNANPDSVCAALETLVSMSAGRRTVAVLGEMAELGDITRQAHEQAGQLAAGLGVDVLVAVGGADAAALADAACRANGAMHVVVVPDPDVALSALRDLLLPGDIVLAKASHSKHLAELAITLAGAGEPSA